MKNLEPRERLLWGTFGKSGRDKIKYILIKDLDSEHIKNILITQKLNKTTEEIEMKDELIKELIRRKIDIILDK